MDRNELLEISKKMYIISKVLIIIALLSPIITMISYLIVNDYSGDYVTSYSMVPSDVFSYILLTVGMIGLFFTIIYMYVNKNHITKRIKIIAILGLLLLFWMLICDLLAKNKFNSFLGDPYRREGYFTQISYFGICGISYIFFRNKNNFVFFLYFFIIISSVIAFFALLQSFGLYIPFFEYGWYYHQFSGPFQQFNHYGYYLVLAMMSIVALFFMENSNKRKIVLVIIYAFHAYILVINNTFGSFLAVLFGLICLIVFNWIRNKKTRLIDYLFLTILFLVALLVLLTPYTSVFSDFLKLSKDVGDIASGKEADQAGTFRWFLWKKSIYLIGQNPIFGIGSDNVTFEMFNGLANAPHNEFIQYALFYGIPGLILYLSILILILLPALRNVREISIKKYFCFIIVLAFLTNSLFGNTKYYTTPFYLMFLICCFSIDNKEEDSKLETQEESENELAASE